MAAPHGRDAVPSRLLARDASVAIVVPGGECVGGAGGHISRTGGPADTAAPPSPWNTISVALQPERTRSRASASRRSMVRRYSRRTSTTRCANQQRFRGGSHSAACRCVRRAQAAVVGLGDGDDMFDIGPAAAGEGAPGVGAVDAAAAGLDDARLDRLGVGIVAPVVGRASVFRGHHQTASGLGGGRRNLAYDDDGEQDGGVGAGMVGDSVPAFACVSDDLRGRAVNAPGSRRFRRTWTARRGPSMRRGRVRGNAWVCRTDFRSAALCAGIRFERHAGRRVASYSGYPTCPWRESSRDETDSKRR